MTFKEFRQRHPAFLSACILIVLTFLVLDGWVIYKRSTYQQEIARLRSGMDEFERKRSDAILSSRERHLQMMMQLIRRQARWDKEIHLAVSVDSGRMYLERQGALLREIPIEVGPGRRIGTPPDTVHLAAPRGTRSVQAILSAKDSWDVPDWVYQDRGIPVPARRQGGGGGSGGANRGGSADRSGGNAALAGALGPVSIILDGGTVIYSLPTTGPLDDSSYILPGSIRARAADLEAIVPNLGKGTAVYFY
jgi:hypothetical protein